MKNLKKVIATLMVALMAFAAVPFSALAADETTTPETLNNQISDNNWWTPSLNKTWTVNNANEFHDTQKFSFNLEYRNPAVTVLNGNDTAAPELPGDAQTGKWTGSGTEYTSTASFDSMQFTKPGIYHFTMSEVDPDGSIKPGGEKYDIDVLVVWDGNNTKIQSITAKEQQDSEKKVGSLDFTNTQLEGKALKLNKVVTGTAAPKNKEFTFTVTITNAPATYTYDAGDAVEVTAGEGTTVSTGSKTVKGTDGNINLTVKLKAGENFDIEGLPQTAKYTVVESDTDSDTNSDYEGTTIETNVDGNTTKTEKSKTDLTAKGELSGDTALTYTNDYSANTVTGMVMSYLPYIALIAFAGVGIALVVKRRASSNF